MIIIVLKNIYIQLVILLSQEHTYFFCVLLIWEAGIYSDKSTWHYFFLFIENFPFYFFSCKDTELNKIVHPQKKTTKGWKFVCSSSSSSSNYSSSTPDGTSQHQCDFQSGSSLSYQRGCRHGDHILCSRPWKSLFRLQTRKKKDRNKLFAFLLHLRFDRRKAAWGFIVWCIAGGGGADPDASKGLTSFLRKLIPLCVHLLCIQCTVTGCVQKSSWVSNFHLCPVNRSILRSALCALVWKKSLHHFCKVGYLKELNKLATQICRLQYRNNCANL